MSKILSALILPMALIILQSSAQKLVDCPKSTPLGAHCFTPSADWQSDGTCIKVKARKNYVCHVPRSRDFKFTLRISVRQLRISNTANSRPLDNFWIRGSGPGLAWDKPIMLKKSAKGLGLWVTNINYKQDSKGRLCTQSTHCLFNQNHLEFRVYQDVKGKYDMVGPNLYVDLPIPHSMFGHQHFIMPSVDVHPWFGGRAVTIEEVVLSNLPPPFETVKTQLLYPPSFDYNVRRKYPLVILFGTGEGLRISPLLETMFVHEASIEEVFVINIYVSGIAPFCALNPYSKANAGSVNSIWRCKHGEHCKYYNFCWFSKCDKESFIDGTKTYLHPVKCGGMGDVMLDVIEYHLLPKVRTEILQNRLLADFPKHRLTVIGYDGAGLLACHAAVTRPHVFQNVACMSAPFHWPLHVVRNKAPLPKNTGISKAMANISSKFLLRPEPRFFHTTQKYYIDYGEMDDHHFPLIDPARYVDWFIDKLQVELDVPPQNIFLSQNISRSNNNYFLRKNGGTEILNRIKMPLLFFFGAKGGPNANFPELTESEVSVDDDDSKSEEIPEECIHEFQLFQRKRVGESKDIPVEVLALSIVIYVVLTVLVTVLCMCVRESISNPSAKTGGEEKELLENTDTDDSFGDSEIL